MPILVRHLIEDDAEVFICCQKCGRLVVMHGPHLLSPFGLDRPVRRVLHALRCQRCGMLGDMTIKFRRTELSKARSERGLHPTNDWPSSARDLEFVTLASNSIEERCATCIR